jgi:hypothetical protein
MGTKHIDSALCIYIGAYRICIDIKHLKDVVPRGNGTLCGVASVKLRENAPSYTWKIYHGKIVWTVNAKDVEWVQCEYVHKPRHISQLELQKNDLGKVTDKHQNNSKLHDLKERFTKEMNSQKFNLEPEQVTPEVTVKHYETSSRKVKLNCKMNQIPANSNDATTGHKLQRMSKDIIIVSSWPTRGLSKVFKNWEFVVLLHVCTLSGLYFIEPIDTKKAFNPYPDLRSYIKKPERKRSKY